MKKFKQFMCMLLAAAMMLCAMPAAALAEGAPAQPTRTERLEITKETPFTDKLAAEGWMWEPSGDGGTLTLQNCYIRVTGAANRGVVHFQDMENVTVHLIGENKLETTRTSGAYLLHGNVDFRITGETGARLDLVAPGSIAESAGVYGFFARSITLLSGNVACNTEFCLADYDINIQGGSLAVDASHMAGSDGIYTNLGSVNISGGTVNIHAGRTGIITAGVGASGSDELAVNITGGDVTIRADNPRSGSSSVYGICAKGIVIDTQGSVDIYGEKAAIYLNYENSKAEILNIGEVFSISSESACADDAIMAKFPDSSSVFIAPADYSAVDAAEAQAKALNAGDYKDFSAVTAALAAVDRVKNLLQQSEVDAMAKAILDAIAGLEEKPAPTPTPTPAPQAPAADAGQKANPKTGV
ncbi:MAG: hypothetical protein ACLVAA_09765 [Ruthenibacterium sp.]|mgnify:FL=1|nr:carbohydrate-binding domain-containing protein [Oscillospiraceae bacterium]